MSRLTDRLWQCRALAVQAAKAGQRTVQSGYLAELSGLLDARDGKPCDPFAVTSEYERRYDVGWHDGTLLLMLEADCVSAGA